MNKFLRVLLVLGVILPLTGCKTEAGGKYGAAVATAVLHHHNDCQAETANAILIENTDGLLQWWQPLARMSLPTRDLPAPLEQIDWKDNNVVIINAGAQPTAGYSINPHGKTARVEDQTLVVEVRLEGPPQDAVVTQVITSPCVVIAVAKSSYTAVRATDETGKLFSSAE